jgi:hypothetical protein
VSKPCRAKKINKGVNEEQQDTENHLELMKNNKILRKIKKMKLM